MRPFLLNSHFALPFAFLALAACQGKTDSIEPAIESAAAIKVDSVISVNMTFDRDMAFTVREIAVVPNNVAPWAGSLFVIDDAHALHRGAIDSGEFKYLAPSISNITPLARENEAGILFAMPVMDAAAVKAPAGGFIQAFQEINDDGGYAAIDFINGAPEELTRLCRVNSPEADKIYGLTETGDIQALTVSINKEDISFEAQKIGQQDKDVKSCHVYHDENKAAVIKPISSATQIQAFGPERVLFTTEESLTTPRLFVKNGDIVTAIDITGGLTTDAPKRIDSFYVTPNSLGGVLRDGALILADNESNRLIYISLEFFERRLAEVAAPQDAN